MRVYVHQPHFLPWMPFFFNIHHCDVYLALDNAAFRRSYFHNRTTLQDRNGKLVWATLPVLHSSLGTPLNKLTLCKDTSQFRRLRNLLSSLFYSQMNSENSAFATRVVETISGHEGSLADLNICLLKQVMGRLGVDGKIVRASSLQDGEFSRLSLYKIVQEIGADEIIIGFGRSFSVNQLDAWHDRGVRVVRSTPTETYYSSKHGRSRGLSVLHEISESEQTPLKDLLMGCSHIDDVSN